MITGISKQLQVGQTVQVTQLDTGCHLITVLADGQPGLQVTEVGADYVLLDNAAEGVRTRMPLHIVKAVQTTAAPEPQAA